MKPKRILYIITKSNWGGAQRYVHELARETKSSGHEVAVACGGVGLLVDRLSRENIPVFHIHSFVRDIHFMSEVRALFELFTLLRTYRPDVVHVNSSKAGGTGAFVARLAGVPHIIFTAHGWPFFEKRSLPIRGLIWFFSYLTVLLSHRTIVVSEHDQTHAHMWGLAKKITCIRIGIPPIPFESRDDARHTLFDETTIKAKEDALWLVGTGELTHNKNTAFLVQALAQLTSHDKNRVFLTLIGDGELRQSLATQIKKLGLQDHIHFLGFVPEARLFLTAFDVFLIPSLKEGMPYGLLEAGSSGLACIGSNVGGIPEVILHEHTGLLIDPHDPATLTQALTTLIHDGEKRRAYGTALQTRVRTQFSFSNMRDETIALYEA